MAWYLNRSGQQEGPYQEAQIVQWIRSGQLTTGHVCPVGGSSWIALQQHAPFAQALHAAAQAPAAAQAIPAAAAAAAAPKKKSRGLLVAVGLLVVLLLAGGAAAAYLLLGRGTDSQLSAAVSEDCELFFEVPSVPALLEAAFEVSFVELSDKDVGKRLKAVRKGIQQSFDISADDAEALVKGLRSVGFAMSDMHGDMDGALLLAFDDPSAVEALLKSERFTKEDELAGGVRYTLSRVEAEPSETEDWSRERESLALLSVSKDSKRERLVWFADAAIVAVGSKDFIEDVGGVLIDGKASLAGSEKWSQAKFADGAHALAFLDSSVLDGMRSDKKRQLVKSYLDGVGPMTASAKITPAGLYLSLAGELAGEDITEEDTFGGPAKLDLYEKIPKETFAYLALSTKTELDGKTLKKRALRKLERHDERASQRLDKQLDEMEDAMGLRPETLLDAVGDQLIVAFAAKKKFAIDPKKKTEAHLDDAGGALLIQVGDRDAAKKALKVLRQKVFEDGPGKRVFDVKKKGAGFDANPKKKGDDAPRIKVRLRKGHVLIAVGGLAKRFVQALEDGKRPLSSDAGHEAAIGALRGEPRLLAWLDAGRLAKTALDFADEAPELAKNVEEIEAELGVKRKAFKLEGRERLMAAMALSVDGSGERWRYELESTNLVAVLPAFGLYGARRYLASSKTAEAKNLVGAISRGAAGAFERERVDSSGESARALCKSAVSVPAEIPRGRKYQPSTADGQDFNTGDADSGWMCLKFGITQPHYYRYSYRQGGDYLGPASLHPGPDGFQAVAEGDLDGDGKTSLFVRSGTVRNGRLRMSTQIFIENEFE